MKMKEVPIKEVVVNKLNPNIVYDVLDTDKIYGFINRRLWTDVNSYAILDMSKDGRHAIAIEVEIPAAKCMCSAKESEANGIPDKICTFGKPFEIRFAYKKWRTVDGEKEVLGTVISKHCGYHYDLSF